MKRFTDLLQIILFSLCILGLFFLSIYHQDLQWASVWEYRSLFLKGWVNTILISLASLLLSFGIGLLTALIARSGILLGHMITQLYIELIRGTPLLVQILFFYYVIAHHMGLENRYISGTLMLSIFHGAYIAEMIRSGIDSISSSQLESARAIGLSKFQTYRFLIFPQAIRHILPNLAGQFASIIKDSSLLSIIGINEITNSAQQINSATYSTLESYLPLAFAYLILTLPISLWSKHLEKRFQYET
ncbi:MAG: amino acid ABC transporter permease [Parachlamydiaceae bacterium]|nr:amino acid ABC transporter permease [Parachlamydiaceae bacterium]